MPLSPERHAELAAAVANARAATARLTELLDGAPAVYAAVVHDTRAAAGHLANVDERLGARRAIEGITLPSPAAAPRVGPLDVVIAGAKAAADVARVAAEAAAAVNTAEAVAEAGAPAAEPKPKRSRSKAEKPAPEPAVPVVAPTEPAPVEPEAAPAEPTFEPVVEPADADPQ